MMQTIRGSSFIARSVYRTKHFWSTSIPIRHASSKLFNTNCHPILTNSTPTSNYQSDQQQLLNYKSTRSFSTSGVSSIDDIVQDHQSRILSFFIHDAEGKEEKFVLPYSWLRDVCQCSNCFNIDALSRKHVIRNFDLDCTPQEVSIQSDELYVVWNDGHRSNYPIDFLRKRNFTNEGELLRQQLHRHPQRIPWGPGFQGKIRSFTFQDLIESDQFLLKFMESLCIYGLVLITDSPENANQLLNSRVSYEETTHYGCDFSVRSKPIPSNLAYTSDILGHHADLPYFHQSPGIQLFHCISQDDTIIGGENQFADGYHCSQMVKQINQYYYDLLCTQLIDFHDYGSDYLKDFHLRRRKSTFELDGNGKFYRINFSDLARDTYMNVPIETVDSLYRALKLLDDTVISQSVHHKLKPGEIVIVDNHRVLHARNAYEVTGQSERYLHGWYWRWDEFLSRINRLKAKVTGKSLI